ncbi:MAG TPA: cbb3-type cytochrome c oxidase subunit I [Gemmatimonadota bacterium]|nr:cbb3-type cytochrome c oxidase subunit I [Gemmatimonadota bacterium]
MIPKQVGGKLFSDSVTRVGFILFIVLSIPVGMHHQYQDPGIPSGMKAVQGFLASGVSFPSLITAFPGMAALEMGGRSRGGKGLLGWIPALPRGEPSVSALISYLPGRFPSPGFETF